MLNKLQVGCVSEEGCGIATITKILYKPNTKYTLFDSSKEQLVLAKENIQHTNIKFLQGDIKTFSHQHKQELIYSHGVLEHFLPEEMEQILNRQKQQAKQVVHYVPTNIYKTKSFGDELLLPVSWWVHKLKPKEHLVFNSGKDLILKF
jgi:trans-aconitate methyltransferase